MNNTPLSIVWLRRDLRLEDNTALYHALKEKHPVLCVFIFDTEILNKLEDRTDKRVQFIHAELEKLNKELQQFGSGLLVKHGSSTQAWKEILVEFTVDTVFTNHDYEPYALLRDEKINSMLRERQVRFHTYKDQVIFEKNEVVKDDGKPYTVFTPYSKKWKAKLNTFYAKSYPTLKYSKNFFVVADNTVDSETKTAKRARQTSSFKIPTLKSLGFIKTEVQFPERMVSSDILEKYSEQRNFPAINGTSRLGLHLRFGTLSVRKLLAYALERNETYVNELIWRDFYQQILFHFPHVANGAFRKEYDHIEWENDEAKFAKWCVGKTGFPLVDAGMRELNATGYMHNRVRMVVASFLTKQLLIDWRWGEIYFAQKLLDFDLAANNGGWQWAAGCGTDAAPYFRVFNPQLQLEKFDPDKLYVKHWLPEFESADYPKPIVDQKAAKDKVMAAYGKALKR